jgi:DUF971 family protein
MASNSGVRPEHVDIVGDILSTRWSDGRETFQSAKELRLACPCATCAGEPEGIGPVVRPPRKDLPSNAFELLSLEPVGAYGLRLIWGDGHSTGIYSFDYLRDIPEVAN